MLFTTRTCPNCRQAESLLQKADIPYRKVVAEESPELTTRYGVRQAPTLVLEGRDQPERSPGWGPSKIRGETARPGGGVSPRRLKRPPGACLAPGGRSW